MTTVRSIIRSSTQRTVTGTVCATVAISLLVITTGSQARFSHAAQEEMQSVAKKSPLGKGFKCSNATLEGRYATRGDGFIPGGPPPAPLVPFATVSLMTFDGSGNLTNAVTTSANGVISSSVNSGTYSVNEDCTGEMTINIPAPPFQLNFDLVIADKGKEFYTISTTPSVVTVGGKRVQ
jgi:hypothetical protein